MSCSDDGCGVSVKAIYIWANDDNSEWIDYVSHMQLHTDPDRRHKGRSSLFAILLEVFFVWLILFCFIARDLPSLL
jgi:hypothetical protein